MPNSQIEQKLSILQGWVTAGLSFILIFAISVMGIMVWQAYRVGSNARQLHEVATETHGALCAYKADLNNRHSTGEQYLKDHQNGVVSHGEVLITAAQIKQSLASQASALDSLSALDCS